MTIADGAYFPIDSGSISEFDIEKTVYSVGENPKTITYKLRHTIANSFINIDGTKVHKLVYAGLGKSNDWHQDSITILWKTIDKVMMHETGQPVVQLLFPLYGGSTWNGNLYNATSEAKFTCLSKGSSYTMGGIVYPNTVTIIRQDDSTLLSRNKYIEIYGAEIGLIRKEKVFLKYCNTPDCIGKGKIVSGFKEISVLKTYSK